MTSCQEYLLKIKLGEMNSIWKAHTSGKQKGRDAATVESWPKLCKLRSTAVQLHATGQDYTDFFITASEI